MPPMRRRKGRPPCCRRGGGGAGNRAASEEEAPSTRSGVRSTGSTAPLRSTNCTARVLGMIMPLLSHPIAFFCVVNGIIDSREVQGEIEASCCWGMVKMERKW